VLHTFTVSYTLCRWSVCLRLSIVGNVVLNILWVKILGGRVNIGMPLRTKYLSLNGRLSRILRCVFSTEYYKPDIYTHAYARKYYEYCLQCFVVGKEIVRINLLEYFCSYHRLARNRLCEDAI
jgi:hypothetical protein